MRIEPPSSPSIRLLCQRVTPALESTGSRGSSVVEQSCFLFPPNCSISSDVKYGGPKITKFAISKRLRVPFGNTINPNFLQIFWRPSWCRAMSLKISKSSFYNQKIILKKILILYIPSSCRSKNLKKFFQREPILKSKIFGFRTALQIIEKPNGQVSGKVKNFKIKKSTRNNFKILKLKSKIIFPFKKRCTINMEVK